MMYNQWFMQCLALAAPDCYSTTSLPCDSHTTTPAVPGSTLQCHTLTAFESQCHILYRATLLHWHSYSAWLLLGHTVTVPDSYSAWLVQCRTLTVPHSYSAAPLQCRTLTVPHPYSAALLLVVLNLVHLYVIFLCHWITSVVLRGHRCVLSQL